MLLRLWKKKTRHYISLEI